MTIKHKTLISLVTQGHYQAGFRRFLKRTHEMEMRSYFLHNTFTISDFVFHTVKFLVDKKSCLKLLKFRGVFNGH